MLSTGNDIVALNAINVTRTKQPQFYSKILTPSEAELYNQPDFAALPFEIFVWLLWSVKEAAFKYLQRLSPAIIFTPVKLQIQQIAVPADFFATGFNQDELTGNGFANQPAIKTIINFDGQILYSSSLVYIDCISTIINDTEDFKQTYWGIKKIDADDYASQSAQVRLFLLDHLRTLSGFDNFIINKNAQGIPQLFRTKDDTTIPVSFSHHEKFVGYSFPF